MLATLWATQKKWIIAGAILLTLGCYVLLGLTALVTRSATLAANPPAPTQESAPQGNPEFPAVTPLVPTPFQPALNTPVPAGSSATCSRRLMTTSELTNLVDSVVSDAFADSLTVLIGRQADTQCLQDFTSPVGGWTTEGPSVILTDPGHQPLLGGARVLKTWNFQTDWIFGAYFCPSGSTCTVPTPGRAISLDGDLPSNYLH